MHRPQARVLIKEMAHIIINVLTLYVSSKKESAQHKLFYPARGPTAVREAIIKAATRFNHVHRPHTNMQLAAFAAHLCPPLMIKKYMVFPSVI